MQAQNLRRISLVLHRGDGSSVEITLLRDPEWIADYGAHVGGTVLLDLPEMAAVGPAEVLAIDESPRIDQGPGRLITGTFHHTAAEVYNLQVESEREALGVTGTHPFWSVAGSCGWTVPTLAPKTAAPVWKPFCPWRANCPRPCCASTGWRPSSGVPRAEPASPCCGRALPGRACGSSVFSPAGWSAARK